MKKLLLTLTLVLAIALPLVAKDVTKTIKLPTIQCGMCKQKIESKLAGVKGLDSINVDVDTKTATVTFNDRVTSLARIEKAIAKVGYDANRKKADRRAQL